MADGSIEQYLQEQRELQLARLIEFASIPSVSALSEHKADIERAADWVADEMRRTGLDEVAVLPTAGHPVVYGEWLHAPKAPTALIYGHYDVQPVDPLDLWETPPFEPQIRDGRLYARGATDDKGQVYMHLAALQALFAVDGKLPLNVKLLIEGEEEVGSRHLESFVRDNRTRLAADVLVISDSPMIQPGKPAICTGLRGLAEFELHLRTAKGDLHSGLYGGAVPNALHELAALMASLHDRDGRVCVPGFYDAVEPAGAEERASIAALADDAAFARQAGVTGTPGEPGFSALERTWTRPTLELNGMWGGFTGEGPKTVVPCEAHAKVTCRLVPQQLPEDILDKIETVLRRRCPDYAELRIEWGQQARPWRCPPDEPALQAALKALASTYGVEPALIRMGGSVPVVATFDEVLEIPTVLMGFGLPEENFHAPNEYFTLANFDKGLQTLIRYWRALGSEA